MKAQILSRSIVTLLALTIAREAHGQAISIGSATTYTQNFDSLGTGTVFWADGFTVPGWFAGINNNATADGNLQAADGGTVLSGLLNLGASGSTDRAIGSKATGTGSFANIAYGVLFQNTSGQALKISSLGYTGELWRTNDGAANIERWDTYYKISPSLFIDVEPGGNSATPNLGTFTNYDALDWAAPSNAPANAQVDGNSAGYRTVLSASPGLTLQPNEYFMFRWVDTNLGGVDGFQGIDDFSITFQIVIPPTGRTIIYNTAHTVGGAPNGALVPTAAQYWTLQDGVTPAAFQEGDSIVFAETGGATITINVPNPVTVDTMHVTAATGTYVIGGVGGVSGNLLKSGAGGLTLTGPNAFGTVTINDGGTIVAQASNSFSTTSLVMGNGATLDIATIGSITGPVMGTGPLVKAGAGTLSLSGTGGNTYAGLTHVQAGTLIATGPAGGVTIPGDLTLENGTIFRYAGNNTGNQIADTATVTINGGNFGDLANGATNPGAPETVTNVALNGGNLSTGRANFTVLNNFTQNGGRVLVHRAGLLTVTNGMTVTNGTIELDGGSTTGGQESRLSVGAGGLTLNNSNVRFNTVVSGVDANGNSQGSIVFLGGNLTSTGTSTMLRAETGVRTQKGWIDLQGFDRTFNVTGNLTIGTAADVILIQNGGVIKSGPGTMTVRGSQTYTAPTTVTDGTLRMEGSLGSNLVVVGPGKLEVTGDVFGTTTVNSGGNFETTGTVTGSVVVNSGGVFSGTGTATGSITVNTGGSVSPGVNGVGTLTVASLTLGSAAADTANLNFTQDVAGLSLLTVTQPNGIVANGGAGSILVNLGGSTPVLGQHTVINYEGVLGGTGFAAFAKGTLPNRVEAILVNDTINTEIKLDVTKVDQPQWSGAASTLWTTNVVPDPKNWVLKSDGVTKTDFLTNDSVLFNDNAAGLNALIQVAINGADVNPSTVLFANNVRNYELSGTHGIAGPTSLIKQGDGILTILNTNSFTGDFVMNGGFVQTASLANAGVPSAFGAGSKIVLDGGNLELTAVTNSTDRNLEVGAIGGVLLMPNNGTVTLSGALTGAGILAKPAGTLILTGTGNTFSGTLAIPAGKVQYTGNSIGGNLTVLLDGGTLENNDVAEAIFNDAGAILRALQVGGAGGTINVLNAAGAIAFDRADSITGSGTITKTGPGILRPRATNTTLTSNWVLNEGTLEVGGPAAMGSGTITVNNGLLSTRNAGVSNAVTMNGGALGTRSGDAGNFTGAMNVTAPISALLRSYTTPANAQSITISGLLSGSGNITVAGNNPNGGNKALIITDPLNTYSGTFLVEPAQFLTAQPTTTGSTLGTATVSLNNAGLNIVDVGTGNDGLITYNNPVIVIGTGVSTVNVSAAGGPATGNTVRLSSLNIGAQTLEAQGANGYKLEFGQTTFTAAPTFQPTSADLTLRGNISGTFGFTKSGGGRLVLTDATTFVGAVTVQAGTLVVNGSTAAGSDITVAGGTLAGTGTIGGNVALTQAGANLAPAEALAGILSIDGNLALAAGTSLTANLNAANNYDQVNVAVPASTVSLGGATLSLSVGGLLQQNDLFFIIVNEGTDATSGIFAGLFDDSVLFAGGHTFQISYDANSVSGQFNGGNDVALLVIPEPGSALLIGGGLLLLAGSRRRREE